jgi:hypothetical protein
MNLLLKSSKKSQFSRLIFYFYDFCWDAADKGGGHNTREDDDGGLVEICPPKCGKQTLSDIHQGVSIANVRYTREKWFTDSQLWAFER